MAGFQKVYPVCKNSSPVTPKGSLTLALSRVSPKFMPVKQKLKVTADRYVSRNSQLLMNLFMTTGKSFALLVETIIQTLRISLNWNSVLFFQISFHEHSLITAVKLSEKQRFNCAGSSHVSQLKHELHQFYQCCAKK